MTVEHSLCWSWKSQRCCYCADGAAGTHDWPHWIVSGYLPRSVWDERQKERDEHKKLYSRGYRNKCCNRTVLWWQDLCEHVNLHLCLPPISSLDALLVINHTVPLINQRLTVLLNSNSKGYRNNCGHTYNWKVMGRCVNHNIWIFSYCRSDKTNPITIDYIIGKLSKINGLISA